MEVDGSASGGAQPDAETSWEETANIADMEARRKFLAGQGDNTGAAEWEARIRSKRQVRDSQLPVHVQMEKAAKETKRNQDLVEGAEKKAERLQKARSELQEQIQAHDERLAAARADLAEAERKERTLQQPLGIPDAPNAGSFDGALAAFSLMGEEEIAELGQDRDSLQALITKSSTLWNARLERRAKEREAEVAKIQAENPAAWAVAHAAGAIPSGGGDGELPQQQQPQQQRLHDASQPFNGYDTVEGALTIFNEDEDDFGTIPPDVKRKNAERISKRHKSGGVIKTAVKSS